MPLAIGTQGLKLRRPRPPAAPPPAGYVGPGDVSGWGSAWAYWGLRGYDASKIGSSSIRVCSNDAFSPSNLVTCPIGSDGYVDLSGVGYSPIYLDRIFDQIGTNHLDYDPASFLNRPTLVTNIVGGKPAIYAPGPAVGGMLMRTTGNASGNLSQPITTAGISRVATFASGGGFFGNGSFLFQPYSRVIANNRAMQAGGSRQDFNGLTDDVVEAFTSVVNGGSSSMTINGASSALGDPGSNGIVNTEKLVLFAASAAGAAYWDGHFFELLIKGFVPSGGEISALQANQRATGSGF